MFVCLFVCFETPVTEMEVLNSFTTQCRVVTPYGLVPGGSRDLMKTSAVTLASRTGA